MNMNVNLKLKGELAEFVNDVVARGLAANKTEAIRMSILKDYEQRLRQEREAETALHSLTAEAAWNNPQDEQASSFYSKRYLHGKKA
ncbi:MAG: hypothetical protein Q7T16_00435 [Candidatus Burarchaeum sp.]|nr:hypothetical protein [Candidatus Burarchaeum sp.]MDO8339106.1 hypothetical protein [Candidatus Burarchaeum sp.]